MTDGALAVVTSYLLESGWREKETGPAGALWSKGHLETVVPRQIEVDTAPWARLLAVLATAQDRPAADIREHLLSGIRDATAADLSPRPRGGDGRVELDIHLEGASTTGSETSAYDFGRFVMRSADAVKEIVKSSRGIRHHSRSLMVVGGPAPGSVRVVLREPDKSAPDSLFPEHLETAEGQALVYLAGVFAAAEEAAAQTQPTLLEPHIGPLAVGARRGLALLSETILEGGWTINGSIRRAAEEAPIRLSLAGASRLSYVARQRSEASRIETITGTLDGWSWSRGELVLISENNEMRRIAVPVPLQEEVAALVAHPGTRVSARVNVYESLAAGTSVAVTRTYSLAAVGLLDVEGLV